MPKMNVNLYVIEDYENETALRPKKTKPIQTQSNPISKQLQAPKIAIAFDYNGIFVTRLGSPGIICLI